MDAPVLIAPVIVNNAFRTSYGPTGNYAYPAGANRFGLILVAVAASAGSVTVPTITLTGSVTGAWTLWAQTTQNVTNAKRETICAFYNENVAGITENYTVDFGGASMNDFMFAVLHDNIAIHDRIGDGGTPHASTITPVIPAPGLAVDGEVLIAVTFESAGTITWPPDASWTNLSLGWDDATRVRHGAAAYKILGAGTAGSTPSVTINFSTVVYPTALILSLRPFVAAAPTNTVAPALSSTTPAIGDTITSDNGTWSGSPTGYTYQWQRSSDGGTTWFNCQNTGLDSSGVTTNSHTVVPLDVGSILRCVVTATNTGGETAANSNSTSIISPPSGVSARIIGVPVAQSDNTTHILQLSGAALAGETLVLLASSSVPNIGGDAGSIIDDAGNTWVLDSDNGQAAGSGYNVLQSFSAANPTKMNIGASVTLKIKQTTVVGSNAANSSVINVVNTSGFDPSGIVRINGVDVTYTGLTPTSLTGCGTHATYTGGELVSYHGQSPFWCVLALNSGNGTAFTFDGSSTQFTPTNAPATGSVTTTKPNAVAFGLFVQGSTDSKGWMTAGSGWTKLFDTFFANHGGTDTDGISYGGESTYGISVERQILSSVSTISATASMSYGAAAKTSSLVVAYSTVGTGPTTFSKSGGSIITNITGGTRLLRPSKIGGSIASGILGTNKLLIAAKSSGSFSSLVSGALKTNSLSKIGGSKTSNISGSIKSVSISKTSGSIINFVSGAIKFASIGKNSGAITGLISGTVKSVSISKVSGSIVNSISGGSYTTEVGVTFYTKIGGALISLIASSPKSIRISKASGGILVSNASVSKVIEYGKTSGGISSLIEGAQESLLFVRLGGGLSRLYSGGTYVVIESYNRMGGSSTSTLTGALKEISYEKRSGSVLSMSAGGVESVTAIHNGLLSSNVRAILTSGIEKTRIIKARAK